MNLYKVYHSGLGSRSSWSKTVTVQNLTSKATTMNTIDTGLSGTHTLTKVNMLILQQSSMRPPDYTINQVDHIKCSMYYIINVSYWKESH